MAHHIAGLIHSAENAADEDARKDAEQACADAILQLWRHRQDLTRRRRPLESFEPIFQTLESLRASRNPFRSFARQEEQTNGWLIFAENVDQLARDLVYASLMQAAADATLTEAEWLELTQGLQGIEDPELIAARELANQTDAFTQGDGERLELEQQVLQSIGESIGKMRHLCDEVEQALATGVGSG